MALRRIVVPLDGSLLAEASLAVAGEIAAYHGAAITLLHALEEQPPASIHGDRHLANTPQAEAYLDALAASLRSKGLSVNTHVHDAPVRDVARSLSEHATELNCDLVVMTTHGRGGVKRWVYGSIAQQVAALNACPVVFVPCEAPPEAAAHPIRHVIVPLDGDPTHEVALSLAVQLADAMKAQIHLLAVVPTLTHVEGARAAVARMLPGTLAGALEIEADAAAAYLADVRRSSQLAPAAGHDLVERGDPVGSIARAAEQLGAAMIVMATHRKVGAAAFWAGSVAPRVAAGAKCPVALVSLAQR